MAELDLKRDWRQVTLIFNINVTIWNNTRHYTCPRFFNSSTQSWSTTKITEAGGILKGFMSFSG